MNSVTFDTLKFVETLTAGGVKADEAKAIATAYRDATSDQQLATKDDLKAGLGEVRAEIAEVKTDVDSRFVRMETKMAEMKYDLLKWIIGLALAQFAALISLTLKIH